MSNPTSASRAKSATSAKGRAQSKNGLGDRAVVQETKSVPVKGLHLYWKNPRVGNVEEIAKSLHMNGLYRPIVVNRGTHTGRKNEILCGNHTYLGARKEITWTDENGIEQVKKPWDEILVSFIDVDETTAAKIVLADNKLADEGTYDQRVLADLLRDIPDVVGTGFSADEADDIMAQFTKQAEKMMDDLEEDMALHGSLEDRADDALGPNFSLAVGGKEDDGETEAWDEDDEDEEVDPGIEDASDTLDGMMQFKPPQDNDLPRRRILRHPETEERHAHDVRRSAGHPHCMGRIGNEG